MGWEKSYILKKKKKAEGKQGEIFSLFSEKYYLVLLPYEIIVG